MNESTSAESLPERSLPPIDFSVIASELKLPPDKVQQTVTLLDDGNTIPFITRFRKDQTGGLNEQQVLAVKQSAETLRNLVERKSFVQKTIDTQGALTESLKASIAKARTVREVDDLYRPFKPGKKSRADAARKLGLAPLADQMLAATAGSPDVQTLAAEFVEANPVKGEDVTPLTVETALGGVSDLLADRFADDGAMRSLLRTLIRNSASLVAQSTVQVTAPENAASAKSVATNTAPVATESQLELFTETAVATEAPPTTQQESAAPAADSETLTPDAGASAAEAKTENLVEQPPASSAVTESPSDTGSTPPDTDGQQQEQQSDDGGESKTEPNSKPDAAAAKPDAAAAKPDAAAAKPAAEGTTTPPETPAPTPSPSPSPEASSETVPAKPTSDVDSATADATSATTPAPDANTAAGAASAAPVAPLAGGPKHPIGAPTANKKKRKKKKKKKTKKPVDDPYRDYHNFRQPVNKFPHHRILAINRGERAGKLKVKMEYDEAAVLQAACEQVIPAGHPHAEFLKTCVEDALSRLIVPSLEREIRRDMTQQADRHAVEVFANNLRNLLLQPPIRNCRVLAIDPGFKRGCSVAVLDAEGKFVASDHVFVVGNLQRREESRQKIAKLVNDHQIDMIAIGNGAACSDAERMVSDCINELLGDHPVRYVMVNEAGASIYSTSETGREELPDLTPAVRSAVSIGRRLQDPLSELVKISPANIGVGMYQHDVRANHLSQSLDEVVEFCVNQVGVNLNAASPSLLRYVSGLNALTARRIYEHRQQLGKFSSRQQLKDVPGIGEATFVQAAGFLRIHDGEVPFDATAIHPESYSVAQTIVDQVDANPAELFSTPALGKRAPAAVAPPVPTSEPTESPATKPVVDEAAAQSTPEPTATEPVVTEPASTEPVTAEPVVTEPAVLKPAATEPSTPAEKPVADSPATGMDAAEFAEAAEKRKQILEKIAAIDLDQLEQQTSVGKMLLTDIMRAFKRPQWDPRDRSRKPVSRRGMLKANDLTPEMELDAQVINVVDFGAFVDIGLGESCLVHVSQLSHRYITDPHEILSVGDVLKVWVVSVDSQKRRVKLTAIKPGSKRHYGKPAGGAKRGRSQSGEPRSEGQGRGKPAHARKSRSGGGKPSGRAHTPYKPRPKAKPKPVKPISEEMLAGEKPMQTFSDLLQFMEKDKKKKS